VRRWWQFFHHRPGLPD